VEPEDQRLPRAARIRRTRDIRAVLRQGTRRRLPSLDIFVLTPPFRVSASGGALPRVGWIVPKLGYRIVARNLLKRRLRDIGRRKVLVRLRGAGRPIDILVRARRSAYRASYRQLECEWMSVVEGVCSDA